MAGHRGRSPEAFSLVELLVVTAIVGTLLALLLPAVQAAREAARRASCTNNLRQLGLGVHGYHEAQGHFPAGNFASTAGLCPGNTKRPSEDRHNWLIALLPYVEQERLYAEYHFHVPNESPENREVREAAVGTYVCPSEHDATDLAVPAMGPASAANENVPYKPGSYRAVSGRSDGVDFLDAPQYTNYRRSWRGAIHLVGVLGYRAEGYQNVGDGASNTLLVGESSTRTSREHRTLWAYSFSYYSLSAITPQSRILYGDYERCRAQRGPGLVNPCRRGWGSFHHGGLNFLLCDGAVRFVPLKVDMELLADLATIDGGEPAVVPAEFK